MDSDENLDLLKNFNLLAISEFCFSCPIFSLLLCKLLETRLEKHQEAFLAGLFLLLISFCYFYAFCMLLFIFMMCLFVYICRILI